MFFISADKTIVLLLRKKGSRYYRLCCVGRRRHYRKDGSCKHTDEVLAQVDSAVLCRVKLDGFGGKAEAPA